MSEGERAKKGRVCHLGMASSIHVQRWVNYFAERGWDVDLITFEAAKSEQLNSNVKQHVVKTVNIQGLGLLKAYLGIRKYLKKINPDFIHAHSIPAYGIYAGLYSRFGGKVPYLVSAWGFHHIYSYKGIKRRLDRLCIERAKTIAGTSWQIRDALVESFNVSKERFVIFSWGVDTKVFYMGYQPEVAELRKKLQIDDDFQVVISPRNMSSYYRIQNILNAIPEILNNHPKTVFIFLRGFGSEEFENEMKKKSMELGVEDNVRFISRVLSPREMAVYLNLSDIMISISKTDQLSSVILEAMMCGCIPILSDIDIYKTHIIHEKNGFFVTGDDVSKISERINYCFAHPDIKDTFSSLNIDIIKEKEDWYTNAKKMEKIYLTLLEDS